MQHRLRCLAGTQLTLPVTSEELTWEAERREPSGRNAKTPQNHRMARAMPAFNPHVGVSAQCYLLWPQGSERHRTSGRRFGRKFSISPADG